MIKDKELLDQLKNNEKLAIEKIYNLYWEDLFLSAFNLLKNKEACEEIVQDVFITVWEKRTELQITYTLKGYLYGMVRFKVLNFLRSNSKEYPTDDTEGIEKRFQCITPETNLIYKEYEVYLESIIQSLPEKGREVYLLSRYEQLSNKEIALRLNISLKTVENHMTKSLAIIKKAIQNLIVIDFLLSLTNF